ncbi:MAG: ABC transporter substrate-binding protein [Lentisphaeria bacterium]
MPNNLFSSDISIANLTYKFPQSINILIAAGFSQFENESLRNTLGSKISLAQAAKSKNIDLDSLISKILEAINHITSSDITLNHSHISSNSFSLAGLVPCPIRIPLLEAINHEITQIKLNHSIDVSYELKAASQGANWINEKFNSKSHHELPDVFISAGFEAFFDPNAIGKFIQDSTYFNPVNFSQKNPAFSNYDLADPKNKYGIISFVPAVFLINSNLLGDLPAPNSWQELLHEKYYGKVAIPVDDFDLFSAVLVTIYKMFGPDAILKLAKLLAINIHPASVASQRPDNHYPQPAITIMPYFFTRMASMSPKVRIIWPADGAIVSPIFLLAKKENAQITKPITDFLSSQTVGEILAHRGLFPSLHPNVDNKLPINPPLAWIGWDFIYNNNIPNLIKTCLDIFNSNSN